MNYEIFIDIMGIIINSFWLVRNWRYKFLIVIDSGFIGAFITMLIMDVLK